MLPSLHRNEIDTSESTDAPWVAGSRDDVVEDDVFGQQVEEVPTIRNAFEALLDDAKKGVERPEVVEVGDRRRHDGPDLCPRLRGCVPPRASLHRLMFLILVHLSPSGVRTVRAYVETNTGERVVGV